MEILKITKLSVDYIPLSVPSIYAPSSKELSIGFTLPIDGVVRERMRELGIILPDRFASER